MPAVGAILVAIAAAAAVALSVALLRHRVRRAGLRRQAASLTTAARREVLGLLDRAGVREGVAAVLLRPSPETPPDPLSHLFGDPDLPVGLPWPRDAAGAPLRFLAQVRLQAPPLPPAWADRLIFVFGGPRGGVLVRSGARSAAPPAPAPAGATRVAPVPLGAVRLPHVDVGGDRPPRALAHPDDPRAWVPAWDPAALCARVPAVRALLGHHGDPVRLLPAVLAPAAGAAELEAFHVVLMGGEPELIQGAHASKCRDCDRPLRFLVQLGAVLGLPGRVPVVYVYGCDDHVERVEAFVDDL